MPAGNDAKGLLVTVAEFLPRLVGAIIVLLAALVIARLLQGLISRTLNGLGLDGLFESTGASDTLWKLGYSGGPSQLLGIAVFWGTLLTGVATALSVLGLASLESTTTQLVDLSGRALVALVILLAGVAAAGWLSGLVAQKAGDAGLRGSDTFRKIVFATVISVASLLAAAQLGLDTSLLLVVSISLLATIGLVIVVTVGQGLVLLSGNVAASRYVQDGVEEGDEISVNGIEGTVEETDYASVTLRAEDGDLYRIPNRIILENVVRKKA